MNNTSLDFCSILKILNSEKSSDVDIKEKIQVYHYRGLCYFYNENFNNALEDFGQVENIFNGSNLECNKNYNISNINSIDVEIDKQMLVENFILMGKSYRKLLIYTTAEDYYNKALNLDDKNENIYYELGLLYIDMNDNESALKNFDKAILLNKDFIEAYHYRDSLK